MTDSPAPVQPTATPTADPSTQNPIHPGAANRFDLHGKVAWILGGAGLLGAAVSRALAEHGAFVVVSDLRKSAAEKSVETLSLAGHRVAAMETDIAKESSVRQGLDQILSDHGQIDICINMTHFSTGESMNDMTLDQWNQGISVSLTGAFLAGRMVGQVMQRQGYGSLIQFGSMYGMVSPDPSMYTPGQNINPIDYGVSKAGILQMVRYQAVQLAPHGVRVNAIVPGPFPNPEGMGADATYVKSLRSKIPMGREGRAEEITGAVVFLASDASTYVTGTQVVIDGGWTAW